MDGVIKKSCQRLDWSLVVNLHLVALYITASVNSDVDPITSLTVFVKAHRRPQLSKIIFLSFKFVLNAGFTGGAHHKVECTLPRSFAGTKLGAKRGEAKGLSAVVPAGLEWCAHNSEFNNDTNYICPGIGSRNETRIKRKAGDIGDPQDPTGAGG
ncbi:hypothetical protein EVAR_58965_1 [Eumeta japonica]|uniref:Uncharacterized protein n=1 Tax=Eumeta variegata TaxID=151549 RepID=A0A4C1YJA0_EUMVA|nr:hypothetical protein EVAR_58965_1 [Eumeta japonica]